MTLGDSFIEQNPVSISDVLSGNVTRNDLAQASANISTNGVIGSNRGMFGDLKNGVEPNVVFERFKNSQSYWEVQIHGGVSIDDIQSVTFSSAPKFYEEDLINQLKAKGIQIVIKE
jgi:hypothetical protein